VDVPHVESAGVRGLDVGVLESQVVVGHLGGGGS
jgi:hypothetical protein